MSSVREGNGVDTKDSVTMATIPEIAMPHTTVGIEVEDGGKKVDQQPAVVEVTQIETQGKSSPSHTIWRIERRLSLIP